MDKDLEKGNSLLVLGPTRITLLEGKLEVFGKIITPEKGGSLDDSEFENKNVIIVPGANSLPLYALEKSKLEIYTSNEENLKLIDKNTIPDKWIEIKDKIIKDIKGKKDKAPIKIMVLGISSGKTTLINYLANNLLREGFKGGYLDSDLGQQTMSLPTTLNIGEVKEYIISSEDIQIEKTVFIGSTFPKGNYKFLVSHFCNSLIENYLKKHADSDFILIDSDGWILTPNGVIYKSFFIKILAPDILITFYDENIEEFDEILKEVDNDKRQIIMIEEENEFFYEKSKDERRFLRQSQFAKVLEKYRKITIPIGDILFIKTDYDEETNEVVEREIEIRELINLPYHYVIIGLMTENSELLKIGLLFSINIEKRYILFFSDLNYKEQLKIKKISLGSLRLSTKGNHQGYLYL